MSELTDLYQEVVLDHGKRPRNFGPLEGETHHAEGLNPLCGDRITVHVKVDGGRVADVRFEGSGCAISKASASVMTGVVKGKSAPEIDRLFERFHALVTEGPRAGDEEALGKLAVFGGVHDYPTRVKCASLAWHALRQALKGSAAPVSTE
ncbi:Fe-S cluster assembly sulfur transfer protein SufU [Anaeromyxobacter oryzae]|uniref:Iron-sulfur cluster assembly scaffold protein n=1 Tax=Anaeromyxobacter oryzae TaxID=2918170 RepID=A0ABM7WYE9_9BACT|nr:SUF system NifU family Fe-S cluster assembly protein [Anaeromyxobacter oryzae]BDG04531.1 iron-sulfur cluster assembly scaffold protein [Anaeromyxobacter oryzae]